MTMLCAKLPQNVSKNRYRDISPCTASQVSTSMNIFSAPLTCPPPQANFLYVQSQHLCLSLSPSADDATRVILKSTDDYINANYINVSLETMCCSFHLTCLLISLWVIGSLLAGLFHLCTYETQVKTLGCHWWIHQTSPINHSLYPVNMKDRTYSAAYCQQYILFRLTYRSDHLH